MISYLSTQLGTLLSVTKKLNFPAKLFFILEFIDLYAPHLKSIFSWKHHGRCFHISDKKSFEQNIMSLFFQSAKYETFRRQLNIWGFTRIVKVRSPDIGCYFHEKFLRGQFELCNTIIRQRASELMKVPGNQPDFEGMPVMPATVTLSIPHFAGFAKNLSSALYDNHETSIPDLSDGRSQNTPLSKDKNETNSHVSLIQSKKRKPDFQLENKWSQQLYSRTFESAYPVQMNQDSWAAALPTGSTSAYLPKLPTVSSIKDTCTEYNNTFSNQERIHIKQKPKRVGIDHSLAISSNAFVNSSTVNEAITSLKQDDMVPTMDIMPLEQSLALAQMLHNQQQVARYNSMNMTPNATISTYPSTMEIGNIQNSETEWNLGSPNQTTTTMPINDSIKSCNDVPSSTSCLSLSILEKSSHISQELATCNSLLLSIMIASNPDMMRKMKPFLLDKKNETWSL